MTETVAMVMAMTGLVWRCEHVLGCGGSSTRVRVVWDACADSAIALVGQIAR